MQVSETIDYIVSWLLDYSNQSKTKGFVIGVSGGIDSAVTSTLCAKTGKPVIALNMPIRQKPEQFKLAETQIDFLKKHFQNVNGVRQDLSEVFSSFESAIPEDIQANGLAMANSRSRLRMLTLYAYASHNGMLVAGTGNKIEDFGVGFFTKYGDGGVDLSPIADLKKSQVYAIAKELNIDTSIQNAQPTDGLWDADRTDEEQLGATYEELEWAMDYLNSPANISLTERQKKVIEIYLSFNKANKHKMIEIPVCKIPLHLL